MASTVKTGLKTTAIQTPSPSNLLTVARQLKEVAEVGQRLRGDPQDSFVRVSEMTQSGILRLVNGTLQPPTAESLPGSVVPSTRKIITPGSVIGGGALSADLTIQLQGDAGSPGNTMLYGTNSSGVKGWYAQPAPTVTFPVNTKGDLFTFSTAADRLAVGTNGQVVTADSTAGTGLSYKAVPFTKGATWVASTGPVTLPTNDVDVLIPYACTLKEVTILGDGSTGSCTVGVWKRALGSFPPTSAQDITGGVPPAIAAALSYDNTTLSGWTVACAANDVIRFHLSASTTFTRVTITLRFG